MTQTYTVGARSFFVTATAWLFIALAAFASLSALLQQASFLAGLPGAVLHGPQAFQRGSAMPLLTGLLLGYLPYVVGAGLALSLATLASAVGLLLRLEWARRAFIGLLVAAIVMNLAGLWLQQEVMQSLVSQTLGNAALPPAVAGVFGGFVITARVLAVMLTLVACAGLGWIILRLMSPMVRQEFA